MHVLSSRAARAGFSFAILALGACSDRTDPIAAPLHGRRDLAAVGPVLVVTNTNGGTFAGSLRAVVNQTTGGETIHFDPSLAGATITLDTTLMCRTTSPSKDPWTKASRSAAATSSPS